MNCHKCSKSIEDKAYVEVGGIIVIQDKDNQEPLVFSSPAQRSYYNTKLYMHDNCWIQLLIDHKAISLLKP